MDKRFFSLFLMPFRKALWEIVGFSLIHTILIFITYSIFQNGTVAASGLIWVSFISWRCGIGGTLIGIVTITLGTALSFNLVPGYEPEPFLSGPIYGVLFQLVLGVIFGLVSRLVISLKNEIKVSANIQNQLEQRNKELDAFGHTVAHDLKNYLTILIMAEISLSKLLSDTTDDKIKKYLNYINDSANNMTNTIDDILLLAGLSKNQNIRIESVSAETIIQESMKRLHHLILEKNARINLPTSYPKLLGYTPWIIQMYVNYISNGIKYGGDSLSGGNPEITLGFDDISTNQGTYIRCWVKDNGAGVKPEIAKRMFKEFDRYDIKKADGHGFGLSIVKLIAEKLGGSVGVESELGHGALFYFTLPQMAL